MSTLQNGSFIRGSLSKVFIYDLPVLYTTTHYDVRIVFDPEHNLDDYGIVNKQTGVVEYFLNNFSRAKVAADEITKEAVEGTRDPREAFMEMLRGQQTEEESALHLIA